MNQDDLLAPLYAPVSTPEYEPEGTPASQAPYSPPGRKRSASEVGVFYAREWQHIGLPKVVHTRDSNSNEIDDSNEKLYNIEG